VLVIKQMEENKMRMFNFWFNELCWELFEDGYMLNDETLWVHELTRPHK
jgi:hypothetical protein